MSVQLAPAVVADAVQRLAARLSSNGTSVSNEHLKFNNGKRGFFVNGLLQPFRGVELLSRIVLYKSGYCNQTEVNLTNRICISCGCKMNDTRNQKKDKNQHVQVFIRVRPLSDAEKNGKSGCIVEIPSQKEIVVYERPQDKHFKKFSFDRVFGADSKQTDVYNAVVSPLLEQVLAGYNCTVFAYGQTGSGKTFTMEGANNHPELHWQSDTDAGMIPRFSSHLFDQLKLLEAQEFTVQVSFLELYNEEIFDLLSSADAASKIRLYEDVAKKGAVIIHGLEEVTVTNKSDVYKILEKGSEKRRTAATLMNAHSSRSHTVFSVTVHIKENAAGGEELMKTGKLNLVDLAGSENVGRSGAIDRRAREAGSINQSLLTLGRVIIALVERASHIPYRESKLTRLLQESLGGRAKTSIIATVSPASINLEETLSTLDYVHRAKHIANKPEVNQKLSKKALLKEYTEEIEKLRKDLLATRERNGVYLAPEHYNEMQTTIEQQSKAIEEKLNHIKALEDTMQHKEKIFNELHMEFIAQQQNLEETKTTLNIVEDTLKNVSDRLVKTKCDRDERKYLVEKHQVGEAALVEQVHSLLATVDTALEDIDKLEKKVVRQAAVEQKNASVGKIFLSNVSERFEDIETDFSTHLGKLDEFHQSTKNAIDKEKTAHTDYINGLIGCVSSKLCNQVTSEIKNLGECVNDKYENQKGSIEESTRKSADALEENCSIITEALNHFPPAIQEALRNEMGERLQELNAHICERFQSIALDIKGAVSTAYNYRREECDRLMKSIDGLKVTFDSVLQKRRAAKEKQRTFAKMMNALSAEFNSLNDCQEESHTMAENDYSHVTDVCNNMSACARSNYDRNVAVGKHLEETMQNNLTSVRSDVSSRTEKIVALHTNALTKAEEVLDNLGSFFGGFRAALTDHKLSSEGDSAALQEEVGKHKSTILNVLCDLQRTVEEAGKKHTELLELHRSKASERFGVVSDKVLSEHMEMIDRHEKLRERIRQMRQELHKFFNEDMQHDVPTGTTPVRKTFSYSRQLPTTSPHDRILQRFRESRKLGEMSEEEDDTQLANNLPITAIANSTILPDTSMSLSRCNSSILSDITVIPKFEDIESCTDGSSSEDTLINPLSSCESLVVSCKSTPSSSGPLTETKKMPLRCTSNNIKVESKEDQQN